MTEQWKELKETITEMRDNDGTGTQQEVCKFLVNYMNVLEKQMSELKTGEWQQDLYGTYLCSECGSGFKEQPTLMGKPMFLWCPLCGANMEVSE